MYTWNIYIHCRYTNTYMHEYIQVHNPYLYLKIYVNAYVCIHTFVKMHINIHTYTCIYTRRI